MVDAVDWKTFGKDSKLPPMPRKDGEPGQKKLPPLKFMKVKAGSNGEEKTFRIRPLLGAVMFYKYVVPHNGKWRSAICEDPRVCPIFTKHDIRPQEKYAINVIDREDGEIKILEGPFSIFKEFKTYYEHTGTNPGKAKGADFVVKVTGTGKKTRYEGSFAGKTDLTEEERKTINTHGLFQLEKIFKVTPADQIEEKLFGETEEEEKKEESKAPTEEQVMSQFDEGAGDDVLSGNEFEDTDQLSAALEI